MATSLRQFNIELYEEHLEEAAALYEQRLALVDDPELSWLDLDDYDERLEAHLDALVIGAELALDVCREQVASGDAGSLYAAVSVFCRQGRKDLVSAAWAGAAKRAMTRANARETDIHERFMILFLPQKVTPGIQCGQMGFAMGKGLHYS